MPIYDPETDLFTYLPFAELYKENMEYEIDFDYGCIEGKYSKGWSVELIYRVPLEVPSAIQQEFS